LERRLIIKDKTTMTDSLVSQGIVEVVKQHPTNQLYSFKVGDMWVGAGKYEPKFAQGDEIKFGYSQKGQYFNLDFGTVEVLEKGKEASAPAAGSQPASKAVDWDKKDKRITYLASRNSALALFSAAVASDSLVLPTKKADRMDVLQEMVGDLTDEFFEDVYGEPFKPEPTPFD
jgi:hypothetical protein